MGTTETETETTESIVNTLIAHLEGVVTDAKKFDEKGNKAASTRVRKALLLVRNGCNDLRKEISERRNNP